MRHRNARLRVSQVVRRRSANGYRHACNRLGLAIDSTDWQIAETIDGNGSLVVDLQVCQDITAVSLFLREAPSGIQQLVIYNSSYFFSDDSCSRELHRAKLKALQERARQHNFGGVYNVAKHGGSQQIWDEEQLRNLMTAVRSFCSNRGSDLAVLELTGFPLFRLGVPLLIDHKHASRTSFAARREVAAKKKQRGMLLHHLRALRCEDPRCVFVARGSCNFGVGAQELLKWHFEAYGAVLQVLMAQPGPSSLEKRIRRLNEGRFSEDRHVFKYSDGESRWDPRLGARGWWPIMFFNGEEWRPDDLAFHLEKCLPNTSRSCSRQTRSGNLALIVMRSPEEVLNIFERGNFCSFEGMQLELNIFEPWLLTEDDYCSGVANPEPREGSEVSFLLRPLAQSLAEIPALQRLHLEGCGLQDEGLAALVPHLANGLPKLARLSLARNGLRDVRLISRLLEGRRSRQLRGQAVPLGVLDLSANPCLGASSSSMPYCRTWERLGRPALRSPARHSVIGSKPRRQRHADGNRASLLRVICESLRQGLLLKTLRLRCMQFSFDDVRPLLELIWHVAAQRSRVMDINFPLIEVSLEGNPLEAQVARTIEKSLRQLEHDAERSQYPTRASMGIASFPRRSPSIRSLPSARTCPTRVTPNDDSDDDDLGGFEVIRRAVSEGDADAEQMDVEELELFDHSHRIEMQHRFRDALSALDGLAHSRRIVSAPLVQTMLPQSLALNSSTTGQHAKQTIIQPPQNSREAGGFSIPVRHVPDMSSELGFVPQRGVHPDLRWSESDPGSERHTPDSLPRDQPFADTGRDRRAVSEVQDYHERLDSLRHHLDHVREAPPERVPQVLRQSLDAIHSDDSFNGLEYVEHFAQMPEEHVYGPSYGGYQSSEQSA